ncbi:hypothetical protein BGZ80_001582 [Entomortierella chlamydospora]|uniref:Uncharacterized protein n=1 Tax=Entomortierella chlamydospora TaxID=101097 RepID=A0A9P6MRE2_9FUNG|nr:hypothetical protein BGZ80_001582 [Entomortierella chlamydospora]
MSSTNASVHGNMWETLMPAIFIETFKTKPLFQWPLLPNNCIPEQLNGDVKIVGYSEQNPRLSITYNDVTLQEFLEAHLGNDKKIRSDYTPPFYFPSPNVTGPDVVFIIQINNHTVPVFVQTKLRQVVPLADAVQAISTTSSKAVQGKIYKEEQQRNQKQIQDLCPSGMYISMVIAYPAQVISFQAFRPDPDPEIVGLERVVIKIDNNNFPKIFPKRHVEFLDQLKRFKRSAEDYVQPCQSKKANLRKTKTNDI